MPRPAHSDDRIAVLPASRGSRAGWMGSVALHLSLLALACVFVSKHVSESSGMGHAISVELVDGTGTSSVVNSLHSRGEKTGLLIARNPDPNASSVQSATVTQLAVTANGPAVTTNSPAMASETAGGASDVSTDQQLSASSDGAGRGAGEKAAISVLLLNQMMRCWSGPVEIPAQSTVLYFDFWLNADGSVARPPALKGTADSVYSRSVADAVRRAFYTCAPYRLPADRYSDWSQMTDVGIDPSEMSGR